MARALGIMAAVLTGAGCTAETPAASRYHFAETLRMSEELVNIRVEVEGGANPEDYAACVAAQYALNQGFAFARHVRTSVTEEGGIRRGDAVYTLSQSLPAGLRTIDAETKVAACGESGIPTV
jgi:hypothetical protein